MPRGFRARHQMMMPVTDSSAGMIPPTKMTICQTAPMPVPSCQRRIVRASVSGCGGFGGVDFGGRVGDGHFGRPALALEGDLPFRLLVGRPGDAGQRAGGVAAGGRDGGVRRQSRWLSSGCARIACSRLRRRAGAGRIRTGRKPWERLIQAPVKRQHRQREQDPEAGMVMQVGVGGVAPLPAEAARSQLPLERPPQPDAGEARDEHERRRPSRRSVRPQPRAPSGCRGGRAAPAPARCCPTARSITRGVARVEPYVGAYRAGPVRRRRRLGGDGDDRAAPSFGSAIERHPFAGRQRGLRGCRIGGGRQRGRAEHLRSAAVRASRRASRARPAPIR